MAFQLSPISPTDSNIAEMAAVYRAAFSRDPLHEACIPPTIVSAASEIAWLKRRFPGAFAKPGVHHFQLTDPVSGRMVAFCRWSYPHVLSDEQAAKSKADEEADRKMTFEEKKAEFPEGTKVEMFRTFLNGLHDMEEKYLDNETMYCVMLLACHPDFQGRGAATQLLKHGLDLADRDGKKTYLEATVAGYPLYKKLGFVDIDTLDVFGHTNAIMIREPVQQ